MKRGGPPKRRTRLKPASQKTLDQRELRDRVRETTLRRAGFKCQAPGEFGIRCGGGDLQVHEVFTRGTNPGSHLDDSVTIALCPLHHGYVTDHPAEAREAGLRFWSWERGAVDKRG